MKHAFLLGSRSPVIPEAYSPADENTFQVKQLKGFHPTEKDLFAGEFLVMIRKPVIYQYDLSKCSYWFQNFKHSFAISLLLLVPLQHTSNPQLEKIQIAKNHTFNYTALRKLKGTYELPSSQGGFQRSCCSPLVNQLCSTRLLACQASSQQRVPHSMLKVIF